MHNCEAPWLGVEDACCVVRLAIGLFFPSFSFSHHRISLPLFRLPFHSMMAQSKGMVGCMLNVDGWVGWCPGPRFAGQVLEIAVLERQRVVLLLPTAAADLMIYFFFPVSAS